jgi:translocation and assembly module TamA
MKGLERAAAGPAAKSGLKRSRLKHIILPPMGFGQVGMGRRAKKKSMRFLGPAAGLLLAVFLSLGPCLPSHGQSQTAIKRYEARIDGEIERELRTEMIRSSNTFALVDKPPLSLNLLARRMNRDLPDFYRHLKAWGYFKARIETRVETNEASTQAIFQVQAGPAFTLASPHLRRADPTAGLAFVLPKSVAIGLKTGEPYRAAAVIQAKERLVAEAGRRGFPFARAWEEEVIADHDTDTVRLTLVVDPGPRARFGPITVTGLQALEAASVTRLLPWREGDLYDSALLNRARNLIMDTGYFATIHISYQPLEKSGPLPMTISVRERAFRSVRAGVGYQSDIGPEARFSWEHRNFLGRGERLKADMAVSRVQQQGELQFQKPGFYAESQTLTLKTVVTREMTEAFTSNSLENSILLDRTLTRVSSLGFGLRYRMAWIESLNEVKRYSLVSFPMRYNLDLSDDLLDPTRGGRFFLTVAPYVDVGPERLQLWKFQASYSHYLELLSRKRLILAGRATAGALLGANREQVPADELFYVGGGGSVRGYFYQTAGDLEAGNPLGGLSMVEFSGEARIKGWNNLGLVLFLDAGRAFSTPYPDLSQGLFKSAGVGVRYYTPIGPFRIDVAFPLDRRVPMDRLFQFYVSLGQSF